MKKIMVRNALAALFILAYLISCPALIQAEINPFEIDALAGKPTPEFALKDVNGNSFSITTFRGKVVLLNFWAIWCPPCRDELPVLGKLYNEYRGKGLEILAVASGSPALKIKDFLKKNPVAFTVLIDEDVRVTKKYKAYSIPTTFLIDKGGVIVEKFHGERKWTSPDMKRKIDRLLK